MGMTMVALWLSGGIAALAHIGDSRAYRFTRGDLELTGVFIRAGRSGWRVLRRVCD